METFFFRFLRPFFIISIITLVLTSLARYFDLLIHHVRDEAQVLKSFPHEH